MKGQVVVAFDELQSYSNCKLGFPRFESLAQGWDSEHNKQVIVNYMRSAKHRKLLSTKKYFYDFITGEEMKANGTTYYDEPWFWTDEIIYYIDQYDLAVPKSFIEHVHKRLDEGFQI